ncbi:SH3 domain-containing protein Dlish isoform X3 [Macrosteles quadrilineatus]|uniref:SH3 domain-containing protein Dlish isoform X3 n=1 Tax=Macrosteles quadrilineatus TaxID=74068 RepID=UPI0023E3292F|nr:SH3 domain-containing protein Dlish isoform X3 [Macrosteles quadrilineatus]
MAFLCPVRIRRGKKKKSASTEVEKDVVRAPGMGRITGSASIETLVRVGIEKENGLSPDSKMVVLHDFTPCVDDELEVKRGQVVNILYRENDWVYVIAADSRQEGFIPHSYCTPYNSHLAELAMSNVKKKLPREQCNISSGTEVEVDINPDVRTGVGDLSDCESYNKKVLSNTTQQTVNMTSSQASLHSASSLQPDVHPFFKVSIHSDPSGRFIVLYTFIARDENDVSVERGEFVTVLNREDPDWYWIVRSDGQEGFVPSGFVYPADVIQGHLNQMNNNQNVNNNTHNAASAANAPHHLTTATNDDLRYHGTELVMLYDYKAQAPDDLSVRRGDWIYADLNNQTVDGWLWAYAPKTRKYGFIPKAYARPPAMTSL